MIGRLSSRLVSERRMMSCSRLPLYVNLRNERDESIHNQNIRAQGTCRNRLVGLNNLNSSHWSRFDCQQGAEQHSARRGWLLGRVHQGAARQVLEDVLNLAVQLRRIALQQGNCPQGVCQLLWPGGTRQSHRDILVEKDPSHSKLSTRHAFLLGQLVEQVDLLQEVVGVAALHDVFKLLLEIEEVGAVAPSLGFSRKVLVSQQTSRERRPHSCPVASLLKQSRVLALEPLPAQQIVLRLLHHRLLQLVLFANRHSFTDIGRVPFARPPVVSVAVSYDPVECLHGLLHGRLVIWPMGIYHVHVTVPQVLQGLLHPLDEMLAAQPVAIGLWLSRVPEELGTKDIMFPRHSQSNKGVAHLPFGFSKPCVSSRGTVNLGSIEEVDSGVEGQPHTLDGVVLFLLVVGVDPVAEADDRDLEPCSAKISVLHRIINNLVSGQEDANVNAAEPVGGRLFSKPGCFLLNKNIEGMFIETLDDMLDKQSHLESNLTVSRYVRANLQLTRTDFKSLRMIASKKILTGDVSPEKLMACTANSLSTSDSLKVGKLPINNLQLLPQSNSAEQSQQLQGSPSRQKPSQNSNLLRQTFGNFRIFKSYANTVKSTFQLGSDKPAVDSPIVLNICYQAPMVMGRTHKPEKRTYAHSQSERPSRLLLPRREETSPKKTRPDPSPQPSSIPSSGEQLTRLPTLQSKPSVSSTQVQEKSTQNSVPQLKMLQEMAPKPPRTYLELDAQCYGLLKNNTPLHRSQRFAKCRKIPILSLSAERVCVVDADNLELIYSDSPKDQEAIEIASLTKVVTALLSVLVCRRYGLDYKTFRCRVSDDAAFMPGTSAQLQVGDCLTVENLLYGLMLPSGNDAAVALAENLGRVIIKHKKKACKLPPLKVFVSHMNILYREVIGKDADVLSEESEEETIHHLFQNPSGLSLNANYTKPEQITMFAAVAYRNEVIRRVVCEKQYEMVIRNDRYGLERKTQWRNTNKLLWRGWEGVKTGTTENAGPCFLGKQDSYILGLFNCAGQNKRFSEAAALLDMVRRALN